jgi:hypothetical protein
MQKELCSLCFVLPCACRWFLTLFSATAFFAPNVITFSISCMRVNVNESGMLWASNISRVTIVMYTWYWISFCSLMCVTWEGKKFLKHKSCTCEGQAGYASIALPLLQEFLYYRLSINVIEFRYYLTVSVCLNTGTPNNKVTGYERKNWIRFSTTVGISFYCHVHIRSVELDWHSCFAFWRS